MLTLVSPKTRGDKRKLMQPKEPRLWVTLGRHDFTLMSAYTCLPHTRLPLWDVKCGCDMSLHSCQPKEPRVGDKGETLVKIMRPKAPRVRVKCGRQGGDKCKLMQTKEPRVKDKGFTTVNSCGTCLPHFVSHCGKLCVLSLHL